MSSGGSKSEQKDYLVQSVVFKKSKYSLEEAKKWLKENKYKDKGVDEKKSFWRFRQLNPMTVKLKGFSHYITKPLETSGVELIIVYKEALKGSGKLNQIKKELFKHFKEDEKLEKETAKVLNEVVKDTNEISKIFLDHEKSDDKPQSQIKKSISKLYGGKLKADEIKGFVNESYEKNPKSNLGDWILDTELSNDNAKVYYNPNTGEAVVTHRGTQGASDWGNNAAYALGAYKFTDRYKQGKKVQDKTEKKYGKKNISTLGHSQGAILARELGADTKEIINVNPAYSFEKPKKNEYNIRSENDVVSSAYAPVAKAREVLFPEYAKKHDIKIPSESVTDVLGNHSADVLDKLGDQEIGVGAGKKSKMTRQQAKKYLSGGVLDLDQDVAFRLKYSFKVGELRKMLKELSIEKKIEINFKEINKLNKEEIINMFVKNQLINPPALPTSFALAKKYKLSELKKEVLKHAGLGEFKKADIINYIEKNNLWKVEEKPNIQLSISEISEEVPKKKKSKKLKKKIILEDDVEIEEEPKLEESVPTGNPKLQMKGIKVGTKVMPKIDVEDINVDRSTSFEIPLPEFRNDMKDQYGNPIEYSDVKLTVSLTRGSEPLIEIVETGNARKFTYKQDLVKNPKTGYRTYEVVFDEAGVAIKNSTETSTFKDHRFYFNGIPEELIEKKGFKKAFETYYKPNVNKKTGSIKSEVPKEIAGVKGLKTYVYVINWKGRHGGRSSSTFHDEKQGVRFFEKDRDINLKEEDVLPEKWYKQLLSVGFRVHDRQIPLEYRETKEAKTQKTTKAKEDVEARRLKDKVQDYFKLLHTYDERKDYSKNSKDYIPFTEDEYLKRNGYTPEKIEEIINLFYTLSSQGVKFIHVPKKLKKESKAMMSKNVEEEGEEYGETLNQYINMGYKKVDAIEAVKRDIKYYKDLGDQALKEGKQIDEIEAKEKPLTKKEKGDVLEKEFLEKLRVQLQDPKRQKLLETIKTKQPILLEAVKQSGLTLPNNILAYMILNSINFTPTILPTVINTLNKIRNHNQYDIDDYKISKKK
jgi:hypothetical protein